MFCGGDGGDRDLPFVTLYTSVIQSVIRFLPGALGFPKRGDFAFEVRTRWSSSALGTARSLRMMPLKRSNSGDALNCFAVSDVGCFSATSVTSLTLIRDS